MGNIRRHVKLGTILVFAGFALATVLSLLPGKAVTNAASGTPQEAYEARLARNENLIVKYDLDEVRDGKLLASKWDAESGSFVPDTAADATVVYEQSGKATGTVENEEGVESKGALSFSGVAHARAKFHLPAEATGMTISIWVKNLSTYWGSLAEFWDGTNGGRFGKGTLQLTQGQPFSWGYPGNQNGNCPSYDNTKCQGKKHSFVTSIDSSDDGKQGEEDLMERDRWYQVIFTVTETELKAYRDGELKQTFKQYEERSGNDPNNVNDILKGIMNAARNESSGMVGIRLGNDDTADRRDILDDFRIYNGAMSEEEVTALYNEYKGIKSLHGKTVKFEGVDGEFSADNGGSIHFESNSQDFPKILIGSVEASGVTEEGGTYSATGDGFSYTYQVNDYVLRQRTAIVTYTADSDVYTFAVTQSNPDIGLVTITSLKIKENGESHDLEGFSEERFHYSYTLSPDTYEVEFEVVVSRGGSSDVDTVNADIQFNGENVITTTAGTEGGNPVTYTITLSRATAHEALPTVSGILLGYTQQNVYVDELPATLDESCVETVYPNGSEVANFSYDPATHVLTFAVEDKVTHATTSYTVNYKTKQEGHIAHWSFEESENGENKVFKGERWDAEQGAYVTDGELDMTVRDGAWNEAVTDQRAATAATPVEGVMGNGITLKNWGYTTANLPAVEGKTNGFTFSTWMKTSGIVWEAVFAVIGEEHGTIFEKGNMQWHRFSDGQLQGGWDNLANSVGDWVDDNLDGDNDESNGRKKDFYNTPSGDASYVFYTVTVTYSDGTCQIRFYKDGELAVMFDEQEGSVVKAQIVIEALNAGASVGLHRHHLDGDQPSTFDEANIYAYAMTAEEVRAAYNAAAELTVGEYYDVTDLTYPDLLLGGATEVNTLEDGTKAGVTANGVAYSYQPIEAETATKVLDEQGVVVTLSKNGLTNTATVKFRRTLTFEAETLGYKLSAEGESIALTVPDDPAEVIRVKVPANTDFAQISGGDCTVKPVAGDDDSSHYTTAFVYDEETHTASITVSHTEYSEFRTVYSVSFTPKSTEALLSMVVTGGTGRLELAESDFAEGEAEVTVASLSDFELRVTLRLAEGATVAGGGTTLTLTEENLVEGKLPIVITNENGDEVTYYLVPVAAPSSEAKLSALTAGDFELDPAFDADVNEYTVTVEAGEGAQVFAALTATPVEGATVRKSYDRETNVITVLVTAADGVTTAEYTITIVENEEEPDEPASNDASLVRLTLNGTEITFTDGTAEYLAPLGTRLSEIVVSAEAAEGATVQYRIDVEGSKVVILVTAEDGVTTAEYTVNVTVETADFGEGTTEDNTPAEDEGGCGSVVTAGAALTLALFAGAGLLITKKRKSL